MTNVLGFSISHARCGAHLKFNLGDKENDEKTKNEIKTLRVANKATGDVARTEPQTEQAKAQTELQIAQAKAQIAELSQKLIRVSSETSIVVTAVMDIIAKGLLRQGMDAALAADRRIVEVGHIRGAARPKSISFSIVNKLPAFSAYNDDEAKPAEDGGPKPAGEDPGAKTNFVTYVENVLKAIKSGEPYKGMRVSHRVREYLSDLITEAIAHLAHLARIKVQYYMGVRTITAAHIKEVVHFILANECCPEGEITALLDQIDEKLVLYQQTKTVVGGAEAAAEAVAGVP